MSRKHPTAFERQWFNFYRLGALDRQRFSEWLAENPDIQRSIDQAPPGPARHSASLDAILSFLRGHRPDLVGEG